MVQFPGPARPRDAGIHGHALQRHRTGGLPVLAPVSPQATCRRPAAWDAFVTLAKTPAFLLLDVVLIAGILGHGLNGLRLAHIGFGFQISLQRVLLMLVAAVAAVFTVIAAVVILFGMV